MSDLKIKQQLRVRKMWVDALRSGEYKQTKGKLRSGDKFCCLGVLADLYTKEGHGEWESHTSSMGEMKYRISELDGVLSAKIMEWVGLKTGGGV